MNAFKQFIVGCLLAVAPRAESLSIPPADMSTWVLQPPASVSAQFEVPVHGTLNPNVYTSSVVTTPDVMYPVQYIIGDLHERYVKAVLAALFTRSTFSSSGGAASAGVATLKLISVSNTHYVGKGFATREITDRIIAKWGLYDPGGQLIYQFSFAGTAASNSGLGKGYGARGRERTGRAHQDLLENTVRELAASPQLLRFDRIAPLYLDPSQRLVDAEALIRGSAADRLTATLDAVRWLAAERGDVSLYQIARNAITAQNVNALKDDSPILHTTIRSGSEPLFAAVLPNSHNLEIDEEGWTPLYRLMFREEHARALALVEAGARPVIDTMGHAFIAAEFNFKLATLLATTPAKGGLAFAAARSNYLQAIDEAKRDIQRNENEIWATKWANILAPALQAAQAGAIASAQARAAACQTGYIGFGSSVYTPARFDASSPRAAIEALQDLIRHCEQRLTVIPE